MDSEILKILVVTGGLAGMVFTSIVVCWVKATIEEWRTKR